MLACFGLVKFSWNEDGNLEYSLYSFRALEKNFLSNEYGALCRFESRGYQMLIMIRPAAFIETAVILPSQTITMGNSALVCKPNEEGIY